MGAHVPTDSPARKVRICQYLALAGVLLIAPFFFVGGPGWADGPLLKSAWNLGHILFFALLTLAAQPWRTWTGWTLWGVCSLAALLLGAGIELFQHAAGRQMGWHDVYRDLLGAWAMLAAVPGASLFKRSRQATWLLRLMISALLVAEASVTAKVAIQQYQVSKLLPALYDFSQHDPSPFWNGAIVPANPVNTSQDALRLSLSTARYSGASLHNFPGNWQGYEQLTLALYNPQDHPLTMTLRINDTRHDKGSNAYDDRFNTQLTLSPGPNHVSVDLDKVRSAPASRPMNMREVRRLMLFTSGLKEPKTVYLRDINLE